MDKNIYKRLEQAEAITDLQKAELIQTLQIAYRKACDAEDKIMASEIARKIRNKLLDESDKEMSLDRLNLDVSSVSGFLTTISNIYNGSWAKYRQSLRDIPQKDGFPFNINFPDPPIQENQ